MFTYKDAFVVPELPSDARNLTVYMLLGDQKKNPATYTCPFFWQITEHTGQAKPDPDKKYYRTLLDKKEGQDELK